MAAEGNIHRYCGMEHEPFMKEIITQGAAPLGSGKHCSSAFLHLSAVSSHLFMMGDNFDHRHMTVLTTWGRENFLPHQFGAHETQEPNYTNYTHIYLSVA